MFLITQNISSFACVVCRTAGSPGKKTIHGCKDVAKQVQMKIEGATESARYFQALTTEMPCLGQLMLTMLEASMSSQSNQHLSSLVPRLCNGALFAPCDDFAYRLRLMELLFCAMQKEYKVYYYLNLLSYLRMHASLHCHSLRIILMRLCAGWNAYR